MRESASEEEQSRGHSLERESDIRKNNVDALNKTKQIFCKIINHSKLMFLIDKSRKFWNLHEMCSKISLNPAKGSTKLEFSLKTENGEQYKT